MIVYDSEDSDEDNDNTTAPPSTTLSLAASSTVSTTEPKNKTSDTYATCSEPASKSDRIAPLAFVIDGKLNFDLMVAERRRHETLFTRHSVRQNSKCTDPSGSGTRLRADGSPVDDFGAKLARQLRELAADQPTGSTSGANRQIRHIGTPLSEFAYAPRRLEGTELVASRAAEVCLSSNHGDSYI